MMQLVESALLLVKEHKIIFLLLFYSVLNYLTVCCQIAAKFHTYQLYSYNPVFALITTVICVLLGYPAAYFIAKLDGNRKAIMVLLITLPMWINMLVRTYAWRGILLNFPVSSEFKVFVGMVYNFIPFMILQIYTSLTKMDQSLLTAAEDLGANKVQTFLRVTLPLSMPGVISGITLVFLPAVSSFFIPKLLGGGDYVLVGNLIENYFISTGDWNFGSAISLIMAVIIMISMFITKKVDYENKGETRA